jgi:hypothetical protein
MDKDLEKIIDLAAERGSRYVKGATSIDELPLKLAELGVLLLEKSRVIQAAHNDKLREEMIELQHKVDDLRKTLFANKLLVK